MCYYKEYNIPVLILFRYVLFFFNATKDNYHVKVKLFSNNNNKINWVYLDTYR